MCLQALMYLLNELSNLPFLMCIRILIFFPQINATSLEAYFPLCPHVFLLVQTTGRKIKTIDEMGHVLPCFFNMFLCLEYI